MTCRIRWKNCDASPAINDYLNNKLEKLLDFNFVRNHNVKVEMVYYPKNKEYKCRINVPLRSFLMIRSEASNNDIISAINLSIDKVIDQLRRRKTNIERRRQGKI